MKRLFLALIMCLALAGTAAAVVNINTATKEELTTIKGIGDKRAQEIIDYRKKNGDFKSVDELEKVPGIGPGTMKQIRSQVTVTGKTATDKPGDKGTKTKTSDTKKSETSKADSMKSDTAKAKTSSDNTKSDSMKSDTSKTKSSEKN
ncbi:MAG TPA: helix-hairpin-helix domain-containing protein [Candidatus Binatia bacterium]